VVLNYLSDITVETTTMKLTESKLRRIISEIVDEHGEDDGCFLNIREEVNDAILRLEVFVDVHSGDVPMEMITTAINTLKNMMVQ